MPDDNNTPASSALSAGNLTELTEKLTQLSTQLEQAKTTIQQRDTKIQELEGATGGFKTANGQLTTKVTELESQLAAAKQTIQTQTGELTNWTTKFDQLTQSHAALTGEAATTKQQLQLYGLIAGDAKYHGLIGVVEAIKTDADPAKQKEILDKMATGFQGQANHLLDQFRAGGVPAGGADNSGKKPGGALPTDAKAAFAEYQSLLGQTGQDVIARRAALYDIVVRAQYGDGGKQQN